MQKVKNFFLFGNNILLCSLRLSRTYGKSPVSTSWVLGLPQNCALIYAIVCSTVCSILIPTRRCWAGTGRHFRGYQGSSSNEETNPFKWIPRLIVSKVNLPQKPVCLDHLVCGFDILHQVVTASDETTTRFSTLVLEKHSLSSMNYFAYCTVAEMH